MAVFRVSPWAALVVAVVASGCLETPQRFPVDFVNSSDEVAVFRVIVTSQESEWSSDDNWTVETGQTYQRQWTLTTHDWYELNVTVGDVSMTDQLSACAIDSLRFVWDGSRIDYEKLQGDGWAGC